MQGAAARLVDEHLGPGSDRVPIAKVAMSSLLRWIDSSKHGDGHRVKPRLLVERTL
jgi:type II secretory pathway component PulM